MGEVMDGLFHKPARVKVEGVLFFDGGCYPNPGPSRCGFILCCGTRRIEKSIDLGHGTNNTAEYHGLLHGLRAALDLGVTDLEVYGDSQLVIRGVGRMRLSKKGAPHLELLKKEAIDLCRNFEVVDFNWVPREQNSEADALTQETPRIYP